MRCPSVSTMTPVACFDLPQLRLAPQGLGTGTPSCCRCGRQRKCYGSTRWLGKHVHFYVYMSGRGQTRTSASAARADRDLNAMGCLCTSTEGGRSHPCKRSETHLSTGGGRSSQAVVVTPNATAPVLSTERLDVSSALTPFAASVCCIIYKLALMVWPRTQARHWCNLDLQHSSKVSEADRPASKRLPTRTFSKILAMGLHTTLTPS